MEDFEVEFTVEPREDFNFVFEFNIESTEVEWGSITGTLDDQTDLSDTFVKQTVSQDNYTTDIDNSSSGITITSVIEEDGTALEGDLLRVGNTTLGERGVLFASINAEEEKGYYAGVMPDGFSIADITTNQGALLSVLSNGNLAVNGKEIATKDDIDALVARIAALEA